jgi:hypothetical protein
LHARLAGGAGENLFRQSHRLDTIADESGEFN